MADFDKNRIAKMQQYLTDVTDPEFKGSATDRNVAMAELFNYYHSDWKADASHFVDQNLELFDDEKMQMLFRNSNKGRKSPHTIIRQESKSKYKRPMRPGEDWGCEQKRPEAMTIRSLAVSGQKDRAD